MQVNILDFISKDTDVEKVDCSGYFREAIKVAGIDGGTVYVPSGVYWVGEVRFFNKRGRHSYMTRKRHFSKRKYG